MIVTVGATGSAARVTLMLLLSEPVELLQATVMVFAPSERLTVAGLDAGEPLTVQVGAGEPLALNETATEEAVVLEPSAGELIVTDGAWLRATVIALLSEPAELLQATVIVFAPSERLIVAGLDAGEPLTVHVGVGEPVALKDAAIEEDVVLEPSAGELIVTDGAWLRVTVIALLSEPAELLQATVMVFAPSERLTVAGLDAGEPLTVQVGVGEPVAPNETETDEEVVLEPSAGELIVTDGAWLRVTVMDLESEPAELLQATVIVFAPSERLTVAGLDAGEPLTVQVGVGEPVALKDTAIEAEVVVEPSAGSLIVTAGATD